MAGDSNIIVRLRMLGRQAFGNDARGAARDLSAMERASRTVNRSLERLHTGSVLAAAGIGAVGLAIGKMGVQSNATQDAQRVSFTAMLHSRNKAAALMADIQRIADKSPVLDAQSTGDGVRTLLNYGISLKQVLPTIMALGDASAASGKSIAEVLPLASMALGQIAGKGKLSMEELNQLTESVGLSQKALAKQLGMTGAQFAKSFTPGHTISSTRAIPAILATLKKSSAGAADDLAKTTAGRIDAAKGQMAKAAGAFTRPFYDEVGKLATRTSDALASLSSGDKIAGFSRGLFTGRSVGTVRHGKDVDYSSKGGAQNKGAAIYQKVMPVLSKIGQGAVDVGKTILDALKPAAPFLQNVLLPLLEGIAIGIGGGIKGAFQIVMPIVKAFMSALGWIGTKVGPGAKKIFKGIGEVIGIVFGPAILGRAIQLFGKLGFVFKVLALPIKILSKLLGGIAKALGLVGEAITLVSFPFRGAFSAAMTAIGNTLTTVIDKVTSVWGKLKGIVTLGGLLGGGGSDKTPETPNTTPDPSPSRTKRNKTAGAAARDKQDADVDKAFGPAAAGGGVFTPPSVKGRRNAIVVHSHVHLDGREIHRSTRRVEQNLVAAR